MKICFTLFAVIVFAGCESAGIVSVLGTEGYHEKKITAEYDLSQHKEQKILVFVKQHGLIDADVNLRYYLTKAIIKNLTVKVEIEPENFVTYSELSEFRSQKSNFSFLSPVEVGKALDADIVLLSVVDDYQLSKLPETDCYEGFLATQVVLLDTATGKQLWPEHPKSKSIKVGFEVEDRGPTVASQRLVAACAYCTTRYLYDCHKSRFSISEDRTGFGWEQWNR